MPPLVRAELAAATAQLTSAGIGSPRLQAELLLSHLLGCARGKLVLLDALTDAEAQRFRQLVGKRAAGEPLQYLTGTAPFRHLELEVGPGVFIPRPETELLVELAADRLEGATVVDLCAGSGAIALAVANEFAPLRVIAVERSERALRWLRRNAANREAAGDRPIDVVAADVATPGLLAELAGKVTVVLANPPYVPESVRAQIPVEVGHDPDDAVFAGTDGLALMPAVIELAGRLLAPGGFLAVEHDDSHAPAMSGLLTARGGWRAVAGRQDLTGRPRFTTAVRA